MSVIGWGNAVTLTVEVAFSSATGSYGAWDAATFGSSTWGPDITWTDVTDWVMAAETDRGFARLQSRWEAGTGSLVLINRDGRFSPLNTSGPYASGGITGIRPWRPVRISAAYSGTTWSLFTGYAISWLDDYGGPGDVPKVRVSLVDEWARFAAWNGSEQSPQGQGEPSGVRMNRILNAIGSTATRSLAVGTATMQATTLADYGTGLLALTADSENGWLWIDADGTVCFDDRFSPIEITRMNTSQATLGDGAGEVPYASVAMSYDGDDLINMASIARAGGTAQSSSNATSRALYGDRLWSRNDLICEADTQVLGIAQLLVASRKDPKLRIDSATFLPMGAPATLWPQVLGRRIRDRVLVRRRPGWGTIEQPSFIEGVAHSITPGAWSTTFRFADAQPWASLTTSRWDTGTWDSASWFY